MSVYYQAHKNEDVISDDNNERCGGETCTLAAFSDAP